MVVDDEDLVRQEQHHVALVFRTLHGKLDRVELEGEVVAEGAEQPDRRIRVGVEQVHHRAQHGEHCRHLGAFFFRKGAGRLVDRQVQPARGPRTECQVCHRCEPLRHEREQHLAAFVIGLDPDLAAVRGNGKRRIDDRRIPAGIAAGIFIVGGEDGAPPLVELVHIAGDRIRIGRRPARPADGDTALGLVGLRTVVPDDRHHFLLSVSLTQNRGQQKSRLGSRAALGSCQWT